MMIAAALGAFVAQIEATTLTEDVLDAIKLRVLDTLGVGVAGAQLGLSRPVLGVFEAAAKPAHVWG